MINDVDPIRNNVARMRHPLPANHELILGIVAKRIRHAAVPPSNSYAASYCIQQSFLLFIGDRAHRPHGNDKVKASQSLGITIDLKGIDNFRAITF